jgi:hypothetical protein
MNKSKTNLFSNEGSFNSKHNLNHKTELIHSPPDHIPDITPPGSNNSNREDKDPDTSETLTSKIPSHEVTNLIKIYQDEGKKFRGELYNILGAKLQVFQDCCNKVRIQHH